MQESNLGKSLRLMPDGSLMFRLRDALATARAYFMPPFAQAHDDFPYMSLLRVKSSRARHSPTNQMIPALAHPHLPVGPQRPRVTNTSH